MKKTLLEYIIPKSKFAKNTVTMMAGMTFARALPVLIAPVLTRLFSPEEFGAFAIYIGIVSVLIVLATGRYELAILLPRSEEDALHIGFFSVALSLVISLVILVIISIFNAQISTLLGCGRVPMWFYMIPLSLFLMGIYQTLSYWFNRKKSFKTLAAYEMTMWGTSETSKCGLGVIKSPINGLITGHIIGQFLADLIFVFRIKSKILSSLKSIRFNRLLKNAALYKKFPIFNMPYSLIATFSGEFLIFVMAAFNHLSISGFLAIARRIILWPSSLLSASLGRVFFQEASVNIHTPDFDRLAARIMLGIADIFTPAFIFLGVWAPLLFKYILGNEWEIAGRYASMLMPAAFLFLFTSWPERIYEVANKQQISFTIQVVYDLLNIAVIWGLLSRGADPLECVMVYSFLWCIYHIVYFLALFKIANFSIHTLFCLARKISLLGLACAGLMYLLAISISSILYQFITASGILAVYYIYLATKHMRRKAV